MKIIIISIILLLTHGTAFNIGKYQEQQKWLESIDVGIHTKSKKNINNNIINNSINYDNDDLLQIREIVSDGNKCTKGICKLQ